MWGSACDGVACISCLQVCDRYDQSLYPAYKAWCDRYFYIPARKEHRGIGGIFFDDLEETPDSSFAVEQVSLPPDCCCCLKAMARPCVTCLPPRSYPTRLMRMLTYLLAPAICWVRITRYRSKWEGGGREESQGTGGEPEERDEGRGTWCT